MDAFTVNWAGSVNWLVPPIHLVARTLRHAEECKAVGTRLVSAWKSAHFWPLLCPDGLHLAPFVHQYMFIPFHSCLFIPGISGGNIGEALTSDSIIMCLWLEFTISPWEQNNGFCTKQFSGICVNCV